MFPSSSTALRAALVAVALVATACSGGDTSATTAPPPEAAGPNNAALGVPQALLDATWVVSIADDATRAPFEQRTWVDHVIKRDYETSIAAFTSAGGASLARAHTDAAGMYRSAARLAAESLIETYAKTPDPTDPAGAAHLLTVSYAILGDTAAAKAAAEKLGDPGALAPWHAPWKAWLDAGATGMPDLSGLPVRLEAPTPGKWPNAGKLPHYELPERGTSTASVPMGDPGALVALAWWHEAAAKAAAGADGGLVELYGDRLRLPFEAHITTTAQLSLPYLFGSDLLHPNDAAFLAALRKDGPSAVEVWAKRSLLAALAARSRVDGKLQAEAANDTVSDLRGVLLQQMEEKAGSQQGFHRIFADVAMVGAYRGLSEVADAEGEARTFGLLRQYAYDKDADAAADPGAVLRYAAWVAGNRNPQRPADMLNPLVRRYGDLDVARMALDTLGVRVSREQPGVGPSQ